MRTYPIYKVSQNIYEAGLYLYPGQLLIKDFIVGFLKIIFSKWTIVIISKKYLNKLFSVAKIMQKSCSSWKFFIYRQSGTKTELSWN